MTQMQGAHDGLQTRRGAEDTESEKRAGRVGRMRFIKWRCKQQGQKTARKSKRAQTGVRALPGTSCWARRAGRDLAWSADGVGQKISERLWSPRAKPQKKITRIYGALSHIRQITFAGN